MRIGFDRPVSPARSECARRKHWSLLGYRWTGARDGSWLVYSHRIPIATLDVHAVDRYLWIAPMLGLDVNPADSRIYLSADTEFGVKRLLEKHGLQRFAALVPGTKWETKHWGPERFAEVGRWLKEKYGFDVVILGTQNDSRRCEKVVKLCPGAIDFSGQTTAGELAAILKRAAVCVTNDSGSMHLAVALDRPVVSIFGPTNPMHIGPYGRPHAVVRTDLPCSPCNFRRLSQCPHGHACMDPVTAVTVIGRVECALGPVRRINL